MVLEIMVSILIQNNSKKDTKRINKV